MKHANITLYSSGQLWSNVKLRGTVGGISATLANPNFLDLLRLSIQFSVAKTEDENKKLCSENEISAYRFEINQSMLQNIARGLNAHACHGVTGGLTQSSSFVPAENMRFISKCLTLMERVKSCDLYDLWWLTHNSNAAVTTRLIFEVIQQYRPMVQYEHVRHRLLDWKLTSIDATFDALILAPTAIAHIRSVFRSDVNQLEENMAKNLT